MGGRPPDCSRVPAARTEADTPQSMTHSDRQQETHIARMESTDARFAKRWDSFLAQARFGHFQQSHGYAKLQQAAGWVPTFCWVEEDGAIVGGASLLVRRVQPLGAAIAMIACGPGWLEGHEGSLGAVLSAVGDQCRRSGVIFCRTNMRCGNEDYESIRSYLPLNGRQLGHVWSYWNLARDVMQMDISGSREDTLKGMHRDTRMKCRRALRRGVSVRAGSLDDLPAFVKLMHRMRTRKKIVVQNQPYFERLLRTYPSDRTGLLVAEAGAELIGGAIVVRLGETAWYLYGTIDYHRRNLYPSEALQLAMIDWARERGCKRYDLGGTCTDWPPQETEKGYGVYRFKLRLGADAVIMAPYVDLVYRPAYYRLARFAENVGIPLILEDGLHKFRVIADRLRESH